MRNLILGPICLFYDKDEIEGQVKDLLNEGWLPLGFITKGVFFDHMKNQAQPNIRSKMKGLIIAVGYTNIEVA